MRLKLLLIYFFIACIHFTFAQGKVYPVQVNTNLKPPIGLKLSDYATLASEKLSVTVNLTDFTEFNRQIKFRFRLEGNGIKVQSSDVVVGAMPVYIDGGRQYRYTNIDLRPYFELQNLQGITLQQYNNPLPDGT